MKYNEYGINLNTREILFEDNETGELSKEQYEMLKILYSIDIYTQILHKNIFIKSFRKLAAKKIGINVNNIKYNKETNKHECILSNGYIIEFRMLSEHIDKTNFSKDIIKELESKKRHGKCHLMSVFLARNLENAAIQTGTIIIGDRKILHTVIEAKNASNNDIIIDYTRNLMLEKDRYIELFNFNILNSIEYLNILEDKNYIEQIPSFDAKPYLLFRNELMQDISKNQFIFGQEEKHKVKTKVNH